MIQLPSPGYTYEQRKYFMHRIFLQNNVCEHENENQEVSNIYVHIVLNILTENYFRKQHNSIT